MGYTDLIKKKQNPEEEDKEEDSEDENDIKK
jgi:hypothetical protein